MARSLYEWEPGGRPPVIQQHSVAKHEILRAYLSAYVQTLVSNPNREELRLVLVDGFAGGGIYRHQDTAREVAGSPFVMLDSVREASALINFQRRKPIRLDIDYFFVEKSRPASECLRGALAHRGFADEIGRSIYLLNEEFSNVATDIANHISRKMPRSPRAIFLLDQYGYTDVPTDKVAALIQSLPGAEVILTFAVDAMLNFFSDRKDLTARLLDRVGIPDLLRGRSFEEIKRTEKDWRLFIQACVYRELVDRCRAPFYTLFFIRSEKGHGDYWLLHLSQNAKARDVMTKIHWAKNNYFVHYGGAGLEMFRALGYVASKDDATRGQQKLFEFDDEARRASTTQLVDQIGRIVQAAEGGIQFSELFATTCNMSPASSEIYADAIEVLRENREIEVVRLETGRLTSARVRGDDLLRSPDQLKLI